MLKLLNKRSHIRPCLDGEISGSETLHFHLLARAFIMNVQGHESYGMSCPHSGLTVTGQPSPDGA